MQRLVMFLPYSVFYIFKGLRFGFSVSKWSLMQESNSTFSVVQFGCLGDWNGRNLFCLTQPVFTHLKLIETPEWCRSGIFIVNFEHISHLVLVFLLLTLNIIAGWVLTILFKDTPYLTEPQQHYLIFAITIVLNIMNPGINSEAATRGVL